MLRCVERGNAYVLSAIHASPRRFCAHSEESPWKSCVHHLLMRDHHSVQLSHRDGHLQTQIHWATLWPVSIKSQFSHGWAECFDNSSCLPCLDDSLHLCRWVTSLFETFIASLKGEYSRMQSDVSWTVIISVSWASFWWIFYAPTPTSLLGKCGSFKMTTRFTAIEMTNTDFKKTHRYVRTIIRSTWGNRRQYNSLVLWIHVAEWAVSLPDVACSCASWSSIPLRVCCILRFG